MFCYRIEEATVEEISVDQTAHTSNLATNLVMVKTPSGKNVILQVVPQLAKIETSNVSKHVRFLPYDTKFKIVK